MTERYTAVVTITTVTDTKVIGFELMRRKGNADTQARTITAPPDQPKR
jgi:hypothetical protein